MRGWIFYVSLLVVVPMVACVDEGDPLDLTCGPGTHEEAGECVPDGAPLSCGPGTHEEAGQCVPDEAPLSCGPGTHEEAGQCVPDEPLCGENEIEVVPGVCVSDGTAPGYVDTDCVDTELTVQEAPCGGAWTCLGGALELACDTAESGYVCECIQNDETVFTFYSADVCSDATGHQVIELAATHCLWPVSPPQPDILVDVTGTFDAHAVSVELAQSPLDYGAAGDVTITLYDPVGVLQPGDPGFVGLGSVTDVSACVVDTPCAVSFTDVDITTLTLGLQALVIDHRSSPQFVTTELSLLGSDTIATLKGDPSSGYHEAQIRAVSLGTLDVLALLTGGSFTSGDLLANGALMGTVLDHLGAPVTAATVNATNTNISGNIFYPNESYDGVGATTASHGLFFAVADAAVRVISSWSADDGGVHTFSQLVTGTLPGTVTVLEYVADAP